MAIITPGLESKFTYNGLTLNDKSLINRYKLFDIDGLMDADLRDSRQENPGTHGETPHDAFYNGRTMVFNGRIEATNLTLLRTMQQDLKTAFSSLTELPLSIQNPWDSTKNVIIYCRKNAPIAVKEIQSDTYFRRDFLLTVRASDPVFYGQEHTTNMSPSSTYLVYDQFNQTAGNLVGKTAQAGGTWTQFNAPVNQAWQVGGGFAWRDYHGSSSGAYVHLPVSGGVINAQLDFMWEGSINPTEAISPHSELYVRYGNSGNDYLRLSVYGFGSTHGIAFDLVDNTSLIAQDTSVIPTIVSNKWYTLSMSITSGGVASGWITEKGAALPPTPTVTLTNSLLATGGGMQSGAVGMGDYKLDPPYIKRWYDNLIAYNPDDLVSGSSNNLGNFDTKPTVKFTGPINKPILFNNTTNQKLEIINNIASGEWIEVDLRTNSVKNEIGNDIYSAIGETTTKFWLQPGNNSLQLSALSHAGGAEVSVIHKDGYI